MDAPDADAGQLRRSLRFLRRVNALLRYNRATLSHFDRFARAWRPGERVAVLDVATGSGDLPRDLAAWGRRRGFRVECVGLDLHAATIAAARAGGVAAVRGDATALPFGDGAVDYVTCSMFLHHLSDDAAAVALAEMGRVARRGVVACDLLRRKRAYLWIKLLSAAANPMVRHDAPASVAAAFSPAEVMRLRDAAGLTFCGYREHFGHRFALAGEKPSPGVSPSQEAADGR